MGNRNRWQKAESGQSLVEMTLGFVILTFLVMGILDLGRVYFLNLALEDAAGEAALYLSLYPHCPDETPECPEMNNAHYRAVNAGGGNIDWTSAEFTYEYQLEGGAWSTTIPDDPVPANTLIRVTIHTPHQLLTPVISAIARSASLTLGASAISIVVP
jgi:hypothetical protein